MPIRLLICAFLLGSLPWAAGVRAASPAGRRVEVQLQLGGAPVRLGGAAVLTAAGDEVTVTACRFYLSSLTLRFADSSTYHDPETYHLIDAEEPASWSLALPGASDQPVVALSFKLGVDSAASFAGALGGPLDPVFGMYWAWQSGYINARLEGTSASRGASVRHQFAFHIGGYARPYATQRHLALACSAPTTAESLPLIVELDRWLGAAPLATTPDVLVPGAAAATHADRAAAMFALPVPAVIGPLPGLGPGSRSGGTTPAAPRPAAPARSGGEGAAPGLPQRKSRRFQPINRSFAPAEGSLGRSPFFSSTLSLNAPC